MCHSWNPKTTTVHLQNRCAACSGPIHRQRICPRVMLGSPTHIVSLSEALDKKPGGCATIHHLPYKHEAYQQLCDTMATDLGRTLAYYGEPMQMVSQRAIQELMQQPTRTSVKAADETADLDTQDYECGMCGAWLTRDACHLGCVIARCLRGNAVSQTLQAECSSCWFGKSITETVSNVDEDNASISKFNSDTLTAFHLVPKPSQIVSSPHGQRRHTRL